MKKRLNEAFKSKNLRHIVKAVTSRFHGEENVGKKIFNLMGGVKLDELTDNEVFKDSPSAAMKYAKQNAIIFYFDDRNKFLGATQGKKQIYSPYGSWTLAKTSSSYAGRNSRNDRLGQDMGDITTNRPDYSRWGTEVTKATGKQTMKVKWGIITPKSFKALRDAASYIYVIDLDGGDFSAKPKQDVRKQQKAGATALKDMRSFAKDNANRYREILRNRVGGKDEVDKQVGKATAHYAKLSIKTTPVTLDDGSAKGYTRIYVGKSSNSEFRNRSGNYVSLDDITNVLTSMMSNYDRYVEKELEINQHKEKNNKESDEKTKESRARWIERDESYNRDRALDIKNYAEILLSVTPIK